MTGAPTFFAQVIFEEVKPGNYFMGGVPLAHDQIFVYGRVRAGRSVQDKLKMIKLMAEVVANAAGVSSTGVWIYIAELPPRQMMEYGYVLPSPATRTCGPKRCRQKTGSSCRRSANDLVRWEPTGMLTINRLSKSFGGLVAVDAVDLTVPAGALFGIIGPNGSGKTTLFNLLTGFLAPSAGEIEFEGKRIDSLSPEKIVQAGIARTFQVVRFHKESTVRETVWTAQALHLPISGLFRSARSRSQHAFREEVDRILERTWLAPHADRLARELPFGLVRQLEIARALATRPKLLLMDEPASGMNPVETRQLADDIKRLRDGGFTIIVIEHDVEMMMGLCDRIAVLNFGRKIAEGAPAAVVRDAEVMSAYLGNKYRAHA